MEGTHRDGEARVKPVSDTAPRRRDASLRDSLLYNHDDDDEDDDDDHNEDDVDGDDNNTDTAPRRRDTSLRDDRTTRRHSTSA